MLERSHLMIVREIEREGSLTGAANKLFLTQSAISHTIKKIEQNLGTNLWIREGRSLIDYLRAFVELARQFHNSNE